MSDDRINTQVKLDFDQRARAVKLEDHVNDDPYATAAEIIFLRDAVKALQSAPERVRFAGWQMDIGRQELCSPYGALVGLPATRFALLLAFVTHPQRVLTRDQLITLARGSRHLIEERSVDIQVARLRRQLEPGLIRTVRGSGYLFLPHVERC